jgi:hypothetical protein
VALLRLSAVQQQQQRVVDWELGLCAEVLPCLLQMLR